MNSNRQSPRLDAELSALAINWLFDCRSSAPRLARVFCLFTRTYVKAVAARDSSEFTSVSRTASRDSGKHDTDAKKRPGSCPRSALPLARVASFDSTSAL